MSAVGLWALALLVLHTALLLLPPIPPIHNGSSVPGYTLSLVVVALLAIEFRRRAGSIVGWWRARASTKSRGLAALLVAAGLALALALRAALPEPFRRFSREEGLWEPLTLTAYLAGAILLWRAGVRSEEQKPWRLLALVYVWLALEELDYFGIFGGLIGRIRGEYVGALHDIVRLVALGIVGPAGLAVLAVLALLLALVLWRAGYLRPAWIATRLGDPRTLWAALGLALLCAAAAEEAHLFGWVSAMPTPEEAIELAGAAFLALYALEAAAA